MTSFELAQLIKEDNNFQNVRGSLLRNHGLIVWGENLENLYTSILDFEKEVEFMMRAESSRKSLNDLPKDCFLTPDHAVFSEAMIKKENSSKHTWLSDLEWALNYSLSLTNDLGDIDFLSFQEVNSLVNWDSEKHRIKLNT